MRDGCKRQVVAAHRTCDRSVGKQELGNDDTYQILEVHRTGVFVAKLDDALTQAAQVVLGAVLKEIPARVMKNRHCVKRK